MSNNQRGRNNIPQQYRETLRATIRFDTRDQTDMRLRQYIKRDKYEALRIYKLLQLGFESMNALREIEEAQGKAAKQVTEGSKE